MACPGTSPTGRSAGPSAPRSSIPATKQAVDFHGLQILVPAAWPINAYDRCGVPDRDTVSLPIGASAFVGCSPEPSAAPFTVAEFATLGSERGKQLAPIAKTEITLDGEIGRRGTGLMSIEHMRSVLVFPSSDVVLAIHSPDSKRIGSIVASAHVVTIDATGCVAHPGSLRPPGTSKHGGAESELVPGTPSSAVGCAYEDGWIARARPLTDREVLNLQGILNSLPAGVSHAPPGSESQDACREDRGAGFIIRFHYRSEPDVDVYAHIRGCDALSASNGSRTTKVNTVLASTLTDVEGGGSFPGSFE